MSIQLATEIIASLWQTLYMVAVSGFISVLFGLPLGILLLITRNNGLIENKISNILLSIMINAIRSIPFIILLVAIIPVTRFIVGTSIGTTAAIVPLSLSAIPFVARIVENALCEVPEGLIEAGKVMGAAPFQIITKILLPEALPAMINGVTVTLIALLGYSAMAGAVGGGGLGDLAIRYGYQRFNITIMIITIVILILLVQLLQYVGEQIAKRFNHR